jgi:hypothetical protein
VAQLGRAGRLGRSGCRFKSCHLDVAKYGAGDEIRLKKKISFNTTHIRPNTRGVVKRVAKKKSFGNSEYEVKFNGVSFPITVVEGYLEPLSPGVGE